MNYKYYTSCHSKRSFRIFCADAFTQKINFVNSLILKILVQDKHGEEDPSLSLWMTKMLKVIS